MAAKKKITRKSTADRTERTGQIEPGNINLSRRKPIKTKEGIATVRSLSFSDRKGVETLVPTIINGRLVSDEVAIRHFYRTGQHLGKFTTPAAATKAAKRISQAEARRIRKLQYGS